jgi:hypothetical protein
MRKTLLLICVLASACGGQELDVADRGSTGSDLVTTNGEQLNGEQLNGEQLNGEQLNGAGMGVNVASASFSGAAMADRTPLESTWLEGTVFHGIASGHESSGADFTQAHFHAVTLDGAPVELRIASMAQEAPPDDDVWTYQVEFQAANGAWSSLCHDRSGAPVNAIPLAGRWNYGRATPGGGAHVDDPAAFTFACKGLGAIAKCAFPIGYKPWKTVNGASLAPYHQACVRMLRADYCGDGTPWTQNGRRIDLYDGIGVQKMSRPLWFFEAEWAEGGAVCLSKERVISLRATLRGALGSCILSRLSPTCGNRDHFGRGTRVMNRFAFPGLGL